MQSPGDVPRLSRLSPELVALGIELCPFSLALVVSGRLCARVDRGSLITLDAGGLLLIRTTQPVQLNARPAAPTELLLFECPPRWIQASLALADAASAFPDRESAVLEADEPEATALGQMLRHAWLQLQLGDPPLHPLRRTARWLEIAGNALTVEGRPLRREPRELDAPAQRSRGHAVLPTLVALLAGREGVPPTLMALAGQLGLSERQTSRVFRDQMGQSFRQYTTRLRVERAMKLLAATAMPVTDVALSSGWSSLSQFHTAFRQQTGTTPGAYRRIYHGAAGPRSEEPDLAQKDSGIE